MNNDSQNRTAVSVVVTGIGMVTPLGVGKEEFAVNLFAGQTGIKEIISFDTATFSSHLGAEVLHFHPRDFISVKNIRRMDRASLFTAAAARMALQDAGMEITPNNRDRIGIVLGTAFGATDVTAQFCGTLLTQGPSFVNPIMVPNIVMNAPAGHTSIELGFRGINTTVTHFAVSAETAIAYAATEIECGRADAMFAGGIDILSKFYYESLTKFRALSPPKGGQEFCRPFDQTRNGTIAGEGCGLLLLESMPLASARGRKPYCRIKGVGMGSSPTKPTEWPRNPDGIKQTLNRALKNAGISRKEIQAVFATADGDLILDDVEAEAYEKIFGSEDHNPFVVSVKGALGESYSSGGMRACALALSMKKYSAALRRTHHPPAITFFRHRKKNAL